MDDKSSVRTLVEDIAKALVDIPNEVVVKELDTGADATAIGDPS